MQVLESESGHWDLPHGAKLWCWLSGNRQAGRPLYVWVDWESDRGDCTAVSFRAYPTQGEASPWKRMVPAAQVFLETGYVPRSRDEVEGEELGGALVLPAGTYQLDLSMRVRGEPLVLRGMTFRVGSWELRPETVGESTPIEVGKDGAPDLHLVVQQLRQWSERTGLIEKTFALYQEAAIRTSLSENLKRVTPEFREQSFIFRAEVEDESGPYIVTRLALTTHGGVSEYGTFLSTTEIHTGQIRTSLNLDVDSLSGEALPGCGNGNTDEDEGLF